MDLVEALQKSNRFVVKAKAIHYRSGHTLRVPVGCGSQISRRSAHEGCKVVIPMHQPPLPIPGNKHSWYSFTLEDESVPVS